MGRDLSDEQQSSLQNEACIRVRGNRECKGPEEIRLVPMPGAERGSGQLRRVTEREHDGRGGERHGRNQITGHLATLRKEFDFIVICNRKVKWGS